MSFELTSPGRCRARAMARAVTAIAVPLAALILPGADRLSGSDGQAVRIAVQVLATPADGATGKYRAEVIRVLHVGGRISAFLGAGDGGDLSLLGAGDAASAADGFDHRWAVVARVVDAATDRIALDVAWQRIGEGSAEHHSAVVLREDEERVLDLVAPPSGSEAGAVNALVRVTASLSSGVFAPLFEYDLWLVHDTPTGTQRTERVVARARSGELLPYHFKPLLWALSGEAVDAGSPSAVRLEIGGGLRGRIQEGGTLDIELQTMRRLGWGTGETGGDGTKKFTVRPGETVALQLPAAVGHAIAAVPGQVPEPGTTDLTGRGEQRRVDFGKFFAGHHTTVFLTAHQVR